MREYTTDWFTITDEMMTELFEGIRYNIKTGHKIELDRLTEYNKNLLRFFKTRNGK